MGPAVAIKITMPQLGESVSEGVVGRWLKQVGDRVERDEPLVEIMTDKVNAEIPAVASGVLSAISVQEGETVAVGTQIALLEESGGEAANQAEPNAVAQPLTLPLPAAAGDVKQELAQAAPVAAEEATAQGPSKEHTGRTSPLVRRLAEEHGIDLSHVHGSGLNGRVTREDILAYIDGQAGRVTASQQPPAPSPSDAIKVSPLRRMIAEHMVQSKATVPHATTFVEVDMTALVKRRQEAKADFLRIEGVELTYLPFVMLAAIEALKAVPTFNAEWAGDKILLRHVANLGFAVALEDGLVVPVIHDAAQYSVAGLAHKIRELSDKARAGKLGLEDVRGGSFTVNNPGAFGTVLSVPIINAPQAGMLTMDAVVKRPVVVEGDAIAVRSMMFLGLAFDHRVNDGLGAGRFLRSVKEHLERKAPSLV